MSFYVKYHKYKTKYLNLKNNLHRNRSVFNINNAIEMIELSPEKTFVFADVKKSNDEIKAINFLKNNLHQRIKNNNFNYFGMYSNTLIDSLKLYIDSLVEDKESNSTTIVNYLLKVIKEFLEALSHESLWLTIRITGPNNSEYDKTRWHTDGFYYRVLEFMNTNKYQIKLAGTLFGSGTVFKVDDNEMRNTFMETQIVKNNIIKSCDESKIKSYNETITKIMQPFISISPNDNQVAIFTVGNKTKSAIHSEPNNSGWRFFYSIVSGHVDDIKELAKNYDNKFEE